ncbi:protein of unknown function DUF167 [Desulfurococcus mucosus DSM 2162]|uniref:UPF0235 protein Desmu_0861 n=1 Tax=Desulfurococcus mucosus (strain ATCC 35584 / DSM 2162 / JCM 9187 / O7/1) TaxID=765177 RepID=E8R9I9_DESM0|nr:DUF167 domain-containing protein [Desulfurococcus mucosus]ADV65165.1 protein of unknown function DUF167 [Desulfurococcus mucosus DSM 2162]
MYTAHGEHREEKTFIPDAGIELETGIQLTQLFEKIRETILKHLTESSHGIILSIRVKPGESEDFLTVEGDELVFYTSEPPERGRANAALVKFFSRELKIPVSRIDIVYGHRSTLKKLVFYDVNMDELADKLAKLVRLI